MKRNIRLRNIRCVVRGCGLKQAGDRSFFYLPAKDLPRLAAYIDFADDPDLIDMPLNKLALKRICEIHFESHFILVNHTKKHLSNAATPTLNGPPPPRLITPMTILEKDFVPMPRSDAEHWNSSATCDVTEAADQPVERHIESMMTSLKYVDELPQSSKPGTTYTEQEQFTLSRLDDPNCSEYHPQSQFTQRKLPRSNDDLQKSPTTTQCVVAKTCSSLDTSGSSTNQSLLSSRNSVVRRLSVGDAVLPQSTTSSPLIDLSAENDSEGDDQNSPETALCIVVEDCSSAVITSSINPSQQGRKVVVLNRLPLRFKQPSIASSPNIQETSSLPRSDGDQKSSEPSHDVVTKSCPSIIPSASFTSKSSKDHQNLESSSVPVGLSVIPQLSTSRPIIALPRNRLLGDRKSAKTPQCITTQTCSRSVTGASNVNPSSRGLLMLVLEKLPAGCKPFSNASLPNIQQKPLLPKSDVDRGNSSTSTGYVILTKPCSSLVPGASASQSLKDNQKLVSNSSTVGDSVISLSSETLPIIDLSSENGSDVDDRNSPETSQHITAKTCSDSVTSVPSRGAHQPLGGHRPILLRRPVRSGVDPHSIKSSSVTEIDLTSESNSQRRSLPARALQALRGRRRLVLKRKAEGSPCKIVHLKPSLENPPPQLGTVTDEDRCSSAPTTLTCGSGSKSLSITDSLNIEEIVCDSEDTNPLKSCINMPPDSDGNRKNSPTNIKLHKQLSESRKEVLILRRRLILAQKEIETMRKNIRKVVTLVSSSEAPDSLKCEVKKSFDWRS